MYKIKLGLTAFIVSTLLVITASAVTIYISGTSNTEITYIQSSTGTIDSVTESSLQNMIYELNNNTGYISIGSDISISSGITLGNSCILDFKGNTITAAANVNLFTLKPESYIINAIIDCTTIPTYTSMCTVLQGSDNWAGGGSSNIASGGLKNVKFKGLGNDGTGTHFNCDNNGEDIAFFQIENCIYEGFEYGINMSADNAAGTLWCNGNIVTATQLIDCVFPIMLYQHPSNSNAAVNGNIFESIQIQRTAPLEVAVTITGDNNYFNGIIWDIGAGEYALSFTSTSHSNYAVLKSGQDENYILDAGTNNVVMCIPGGKLFCQNLSVLPDNTIMEISSSGTGDLHLNRYSGNGGDIQLFGSTLQNPLLSIGGWGGAALQTGTLQIANNGVFVIKAPAGENLKLDSDSGSIYIEDVLQLAPRATEPSPASNGMIYYNSTDNHIYCRLLGAWVQLDN